MKALLLVVALVAVAAAAARPKWHQLEGYTFAKYVADFNKPYEQGTPEYAMREATFNNRLAIIRAHNADKTHTWKRGVNLFSDMSAEEWKAFNAFKKAEDRPAPTSVYAHNDDGAALPAVVDYRTWTSPRVLTAIKHQGSCGNCWAFSTVESMEAHYALQTGLLPVFSVQQVTSCTGVPNRTWQGTGGCGGGDYSHGWRYINSTKHGLTEEWAYPFVNFFYDYKDPNATTAKCYEVSKLYPKKPYSWFAELNEGGTHGYVHITPNSNKHMMSALARVGPMSISVAAGNWQDYESGVFQNTNASGTINEWGVDHAVQIVGYGTDREAGKDYWIVRNSWSTLWGDDGFIYLDRPAVEPCCTDMNVCPPSHGKICGTSGVLSDGAYPLVHKRTPVKF